MPAAGIPFHATPMPSLRDPESRVALLRTVVSVPLAFFDALVSIARFRPDVCCTTGGIVAIPVTLAAWLMRVPVYLWDGNALPGRATRLLAPFCSRIGVSYEQARHAFANIVEPLLSVSKCPDFIVNRGHYFGTGFVDPGATDLIQEAALSDDDKRALIEFVKTF